MMTRRAMDFRKISMALFLYNHQTNCYGNQHTLYYV